MQHAANGAAALLAQNRQRVVFGFACVNDDGQIERARELDLRSEDALLRVFRREVVVVVEADFADGARQRISRELRLHQHGGVLLPSAEFRSLMGMNAHRRPQPRPQLSSDGRA